MHRRKNHRQEHRRTMGLVCLSTVGWLILAAATQAGPGEQVQEFIENTAEIIERAAGLVLETENQQARRILDGARNLHRRSLHLLERGQERQALAVSRRAREAAQHAARLARETHGHQERFRLRLERFQDLREQYGDRAQEAANERAIRFLREADRQAHRAMDHHRQGNHDLALHILSAAEELLARATRLLHDDLGGERLQREIERTRSLLELAAEQLQESSTRQRETASDLLQSAAEALRRAEDHHSRQQPIRAWHALRLARRLAAQVSAASAEPPHPDVVADQIARWDERHEHVAEKIRESGPAQAATMLSRAKHHRDQAERRLADGETEAALRQLRAAFDLLNEASELVR